MSGNIKWLAARFVDVDGTARPGGYDIDGDTNGVAAIRITSQEDGDGVIIEGRPETLRKLADEILRTADLILQQTMREPALRRIYGIGMTKPEEEETPPSQVGMESLRADFDTAVTRAHASLDLAREKSEAAVALMSKREIQIARETTVRVADHARRHDYAFHRDGEPCLVAITSQNCPHNHRYGRTFESAH